MSKPRRKKGKLPPFIPVIRTTWASPAWKQLSYGARCLYIVLRSYLRHDNLNNGKVFRSYREAANDLGTKSLTSVQRWFRELEHYGFVAMTTGACLGVDGDGISAHWRITECPTFDSKGTHIAPTRDFDRWDGTLFVDPGKTESRTQNGNTPYLQQVHTGAPKRDQKRSRCTQNGYIDLAFSMYPKQVHNCLPPPSLPKQRQSAVSQPLPKGTAVNAGRVGELGGVGGGLGPTALVLELVAKLPTELRMMGVGLRP